MESWTPWIGSAALAALVLFTTLDTTLRGPSRSRMANQMRRRGRGAALDNFHALRPEYYLATATVRAGALVLLWLCVLSVLEIYHADVTLSEFAVAGLTCWGLFMVFGVAIPTAWAKYAGERLVVSVLPLLSFCRWSCYPIILALGWFDPLVRRLTGVPIRSAQSFANELEQEILDAVSEGERHGAVDEEEKEMIESVIELSETRVEEIMTPRTDIVALPHSANLDEVLAMIRSKGHSRMPVFGDTIDEIQGVLYAKDLLRRDAKQSFSVSEVMREVLFIPESKFVRDLLREFQSKKVHIAIVLDEYGGTAGLMTIEDILEELVGEIVDEYETEGPVELKRINETTVEVDARMRIDELNDELNIHLPEDGDYETLGGFVFSTLGKIPQAGESCQHENIGIHVVAAEPRRITRLRITVSPTPDTDEDST